MLMESNALKKSVERNENIKKNNTKSQQIKIKSSDHYHADNSNQVITFAKKWLSNQ